MHGNLDGLPNRDNPEMTAQLLAAIKQLRGYALRITSNRDRANDLTQETFFRCWRTFHHFTPGTNMEGWTLVVMRNTYRNWVREEMRIKKLKDSQRTFCSVMPSPEDVELPMCLERMRPHEHMALLAIHGLGLSYIELAEIQGVQPGTAKSRTARAREAFQGMVRAPA